MRILWASNNPSSPSGYGVQTDLFTRRIKAAGHEVAIASNYGLDEGMIYWPTEAGEIPIYPKSGHRFGIDILPHHAADFGAECVITHYDSWVYDPSLMAGRWVPWFPVDCEELPKPIAERVPHAMMRITQTRDAVEKAARLDIECEYVPAGYDGTRYYPRERSLWREAHGIADDTFVVGMVAANRGEPGAPSRKSYPQAIEAFSLLLGERPDAILYLHTITQNTQGGHVDLPSIAQRFGIPEGNVRIANAYYLHCGKYSPDDMAILYSGLDVLLSPSMGEGFGVPIVEAQACGTPVIVGDWTAMAEVGKSGARIAKEDAFRYPLIGYGDMWLPRPEAIAEKLIEAQSWPHDEETRTRIADAVLEYEADTVYEENWRPTLEKLGGLVRKQNELVALQQKLEDGVPLNREQARAGKREKRTLQSKKAVAV